MDFFASGLPVLSEEPPTATGELLSAKPNASTCGSHVYKLRNYVNHVTFI